MITSTDINVSIDQLFLDPNNYRLADEKEQKDVPDSDVESLQDTVQKHLEMQRLGELKDSIKFNGFLEMERIVIRLLRTKQNLNEKDINKKKYVVVEGNRRTAAIKSIKNNKESDNSVLLEKFNSLSVILIDGDEKDLRTYSATIMGIRHVSGPKKWDGFQSAKLINDLYNDGHSFTEIGDILGISSREVGRRFRGYQAFLQMREDQDYKAKVEPRHYALLLEFLASTNDGKSWLQWNDNSYKFDNKENLKRVYTAITKDENGENEIRNPADARKFIALLGSSYKEQIEAGISIHEMPDPQEDKKSGGVTKRIERFTNFVNNNDFDDVESEALIVLLNAINSKVGIFQ